MKVTIEIPKSAIKKAAYFLMSQTTDEKDYKTIDKAVEAFEKVDCFTIQKEIIKETIGDGAASKMYLAFAAAAFAAKVREIEAVNDPI